MPGSEAAVVGKGVGTELDDDESGAVAPDITENNYWNDKMRVTVQLA